MCKFHWYGRQESTVFRLKDMMLKLALRFYYISNCNKSRKIKLYETTVISCKTLACKNFSLPSFIFIFSLKAKAKPGRGRQDEKPKFKVNIVLAKHSIVK